MYGEVGYRVGGTGLGSGATISQSLGYNFGDGSWNTTTTANAYASFGAFSVGGNYSDTYNFASNQWSNGWGVSAGVGFAGMSISVGYGSGGWSYGFGGYYQSKQLESSSNDPRYMASNDESNLEMFLNSGGVIIMNRTWETDNSTISTFTTHDGSVSGYMMEPAGPSTTTKNLDRRIPEGTYYLMPHSSKDYPKAFKLYNNQVPKSRGILIHTGNYPRDTEGCLMPGKTRGVDFVGKSGGKNGLMRPLNSYINKHIYKGGVQVIIRDPIKY